MTAAALADGSGDGLADTVGEAVDPDGFTTGDEHPTTAPTTRETATTTEKTRRRPRTTTTPHHFPTVCAGGFSPPHAHGSIDTNNAWASAR